MHRFKKIYTFLFCVYKMVESSAETFTKNCIDTITQLRKGKKSTL